MSHPSINELGISHLNWADDRPILWPTTYIYGQDVEMQDIKIFSTKDEKTEDVASFSDVFGFLYKYYSVISTHFNSISSTVKYLAPHHGPLKLPMPHTPAMLAKRNAHGRLASKPYRLSLPL